jgi:ribonuclease J
MVSRGFIYLKQSEDLANEIKNKATDIFTEVLAGYKILNLPQIKQKVTYKLSQYIYEKTERKPIIVPLIFII